MRTPFTRRPSRPLRFQAAGMATSLLLSLLTAGVAAVVTSAPAQAVVPAPTVVQVEMMDYASCALMSDTTVRCWGRNYEGDVGIGVTSEPVLRPSTVRFANGDTLTGVTQLAGGEYYMCARLVDTTVRCWGFSNNGVLTFPERRESDSPVTVLTNTWETLTGVASIGAGVEHACAVMLDGSARCWGTQGRGALGDGVNGLSGGAFYTKTVLGLDGGESLTGVAQIAPGSLFTCALLVDTRVACWGDNAYGKVGETTTVRWQLTPKIVAGATGTETLTGVASVTARGEAVCALLTNGGLKCWGDNRNGVVTGVMPANTWNGELRVNATPVTHVLPQPAIAVRAEGGGMCAVLADTTVRCWGSGWLGALGNNRTVDTGTLQTVVNADGSVFTGATSLAGGWGACALGADIGLWCWGNNTYGQAGSGDTSTALTPVRVVDIGAPAPPKRQLSVTVAGTGVGQVAGSGIDCPGTCDGTFDSGTVVTLTETPTAGSIFGGWSGACTGTARTCTVTVNQARSVGAAFGPITVASINTTDSATIGVTSGSGESVTITIPTGALSRTGSTTDTVTVAGTSTAEQLASGIIAVSITIVDDSGRLVTSFAQPLVINLGPPPPGGAVTFSVNGTAWTSIPRLTGTTLPNNMSDGYYINGSGNVIVLTRHLTIFATHLEQETLTASAPSATAGDVVTVAVGGGSGEGALSFTSSTSGVCSVTDSGQVTTLGAGTCNIVVTKDGDAIYAPTSATARIAVAAPQQVHVVGPTVEFAKNVSVAVDSSSATISWSPAAPSDEVAPERYVVGSIPGNRTCTVNAPALSCTVTGLESATSYAFTVTVFGAHSSATLTTAPVTTKAASAPVITPPVVTPVVSASVALRGSGAVRVLKAKFGPQSAGAGVVVRVLYQGSSKYRIHAHGTLDADGRYSTSIRVRRGDRVSVTSGATSLRTIVR